MICSGRCFLPFIESLLAPAGPMDSHNTWINFWGAGHWNDATVVREMARKDRAEAKRVAEGILAKFRTVQEANRGG